MSDYNLRIEPVLLVHGGAGYTLDSSIPAKYCGVKLAAGIGYNTLCNTGSVLDAVQAAVSCLEANPNFNAGYGSMLNWEGKIEMDAAIMEGATLNAGCVSLVSNIYHPILLARNVLEHTSHVFLAGEGAMDFAAHTGIPLLPDGALATTKSIHFLEEYKSNFCNNLQKVELSPIFCEWCEPGTVGAVGIDVNGNVAAATSTGGVTGKLPGRIGNTPILGGGTYADNASGAVSATGHGETLMRFNAASRILRQIEENCMSAQNSTEKVLNDMMERFNQTAGVVSIDANGRIGIYFTTPRMAWAYQRGQQLHYGINKGEDLIECVNQGCCK